MAKFAQASAADRSVFAQLTDINAYIQQHVADISSNNDELQQNLLALQYQINMMNLVQNPSITPIQTQRPHTTGHPPQYPQYQQPPPQGYQLPPMQHALPPHILYRQIYVQRGGYRGRRRGCYLSRGAAQGQYQQQGQYLGLTQQYGDLSLQPYHAPSHHYGRGSNN